jgi:hypothetical protein
LVARLFGERVRLAELGIVDPSALRAATDTYLSGEGDDFLRVNLFHTMKTEFWLRGLERRAPGERSAGVARPAEVEFPAA